MPTWKARSAETRDLLGMHADARPWTCMPHVKLQGLPATDRFKDVLDVCFGHVQRKSPTLPWPKLVTSLWANAGHSVQRLPVSTKPETLTHNAVIYSYEQDRALTGDEHLRLLGWGKRMAPREIFTEADRRSLAADGFSVPISAQVCYAYYLKPYAPWWR